MKNILSILLTLCLATAIFADYQVIREFTAEAEDQQAIITWETGAETGVSQFLIERSFDGDRFYEVADVDPMGNNHDYKFVDRDLFKGHTNTYYYRINVKMTNGSSQFSVIGRILMNSSGIERTWGSIKAMFR